MSSLESLKNQIENANALGRGNLEAQGISTTGNETTYQIMKKIGDITGSGSPSVVKVQSDWEQTDPSDNSYIKNKPFEIGDVEITYTSTFENDTTIVVEKFEDFEEGSLYDVCIEGWNEYENAPVIYNFTNVKATNASVILGFNSPGICIGDIDIPGIDCTYSEHVDFMIINNVNIVETSSSSALPFIEDLDNCVIQGGHYTNLGQPYDGNFTYTITTLKKKPIVKEKWTEMFQPNWEENDKTSSNYIVNKPFYLDTQINNLCTEEYFPATTTTEAPQVFSVNSFAKIKAGNLYNVEITTKNLDTQELEIFSFEDVPVTNIQAEETLTIPILAIGPSEFFEDSQIKNVISNDVLFVFYDGVNVTDSSNVVADPNMSFGQYARLDMATETIFSNVEFYVTIKGEKESLVVEPKMKQFLQPDFEETDPENLSFIKNSPFILKDNSYIIASGEGVTNYQEELTSYGQLEIGEKYTVIIKTSSEEKIFSNVECTYFGSDYAKSLWIVTPEIKNEYDEMDYYFPAVVNDEWIFRANQETENEINWYCQYVDLPNNKFSVSVTIIKEDYNVIVNNKYSSVFIKDYDENDKNSSRYIENRPCYYYETEESYTPIIIETSAFTMNGGTYGLVESDIVFETNTSYSVLMAAEYNGLVTLFTTDRMVGITGEQTGLDLENVTMLKDAYYTDLTDPAIMITGIDLDVTGNIIEGNKLAYLIATEDDDGGDGIKFIEWRLMDIPGKRITKKQLTHNCIPFLKRINSLASHENFPTTLAVKEYVEERLKESPKKPSLQIDYSVEIDNEHNRAFAVMQDSSDSNKTIEIEECYICIETDYEVNAERIAQCDYLELIPINYPNEIYYIKPTEVKTTTSVQADYCLNIYFEFYDEEHRFSISTSNNGLGFSTVIAHKEEFAADSSHSQNSSIALGENSHAEGTGTIAKGESQHTQGKFNVIDEENKYAHIVGNGTDDEHRSNAYTLDWQGNAEYSGSVSTKDIILKLTNENKSLISIIEDLTNRIITLEQNQTDVISDYDLASDLLGGNEE